MRVSEPHRLSVLVVVIAVSLYTAIGCALLIALVVVAPR
jgi:hypothetical protein